MLDDRDFLQYFDYKKNLANYMKSKFPVDIQEQISCAEEYTFFNFSLQQRTFINDNKIYFGHLPSLLTATVNGKSFRKGYEVSEKEFNGTHLQNQQQYLMGLLYLFYQSNPTLTTNAIILDKLANTFLDKFKKKYLTDFSEDLFSLYFSQSIYDTTDSELFKNFAYYSKNLIDSRRSYPNSPRFNIFSLSDDEVNTLYKNTTIEFNTLFNLNNQIFKDFPHLINSLNRYINKFITTCDLNSTFSLNTQEPNSFEAGLREILLLNKISSQNVSISLNLPRKKI